MAVHKRKKKSLLSPDYDPWYGYDTYSDGFRIVPKKKFRLNSDKEIEKIEYERIAIKAVQFFHNYDTKLQKHTGLIITSTTEKELRKASKSSAGELYVEGQDKVRGSWEIVFPETNLKQLDKDVLWFSYEGTSTFVIK